MDADLLRVMQFKYFMNLVILIEVESYAMFHRVIMTKIMQLRNAIL